MQVNWFAALSLRQAGPGPGATFLKLWATLVSITACLIIGCCDTVDVDCEALLGSLQWCGPGGPTPGTFRHALYLGAAQCVAGGPNTGLALKLCTPEGLGAAVGAEFSQLFARTTQPLPHVQWNVTEEARPGTGRLDGGDSAYGAGVAAQIGVPATAVAHGIISTAEGMFQDLIPADLLLDMSGLVGLDASFDQADVLLPLRHKLSNPAIVPLDGSALLLVYRRDVFMSMGQQVPETWDDLAALVESYAELRPAWAPAALLCGTNGPSCDGSALFYAIWHSIAQSQGQGQGVFFQPETMGPLAGTAAFVAAARLFVRLWRLALPQPAGQCSFVHPGLRQGGCAVAIGTVEQVKDVALAPGGVSPNSGVGAAASITSPPAPPAVASSSFGVTELPGSLYTLDSTNSSNLVACTAQLCPYGDAVAEQLAPASNASPPPATGAMAQGQPSGERQPAAATQRRARRLQATTLNRAPYVPSSLLVAGIHSRSPVSSQLLAWHVLSHLASSNVSLRLVLAPGSGMAPFRASHFSGGARAAWAAAGYDARLANEALDVLQRALLHRNLAWGLCMADGAFYRAVVSAFLDRIVTASSSSPLAAADLWREAIAVQEALSGHYKPTPTPPPASPSDAGGRSANDRSAAVGVSVSVPCFVALLLLLYAGHRYGWRLAQRRPAKAWRTGAPPASPFTTLLVTDIEGSTQLWEELPEIVMGYALQVHHTCLRRVLVRNQGYESATEGDSFIMAFDGPNAALNFALEAQQELLEQDWPAELLKMESCMPVYTSLPLGFPLKKHATLDTVLSRMSLRPHSHTASAPVVTPSSAYGGGSATFSLPPQSSTGTRAVPLLASFGHGRLALSQSPTLSMGRSMGRSRTPTAVRQRASIDLGQLNVNNNNASQCGFAPRTVATTTELELSALTAPTAAAVTAAALELVSTMAPLLTPRSQTGTSRDSRPSGTSREDPHGQQGFMSPGTGTGTTTTRVHELPTTGELSDQLRARASTESAPAYVNPFRSVPLAAAAVVPTVSIAARPPPAAAGPTRRQGELSRRLQELHEHQILQQRDMASTGEHTASVRYPSSNSGWAIIHGGDGAGILDDGGEGGEAAELCGSGPHGANRSAGITGAATAATACSSLRGSCVGVGASSYGYASGPSHAHTVSGLSATPGASRDPTGSGMTIATTGGGGGIGGGAMTTACAVAVVSGGGTSEPLPKLSLGVVHPAPASSQGRMAVLPATPMVTPIHTQRLAPRAMASPLLPSVATGAGTGGAASVTMSASGAYATWSLPWTAWEVCTLEESLRATVRSLEGGTLGDRKRRLLWRGLRVRMGLHSGVASSSELVYNRASARTVYSGECASIVRAVADSAQGGMVLLSEACTEALERLGASGPAAEALLVYLGRWRIRHKDLPLPFYLAATPELAPRAATLSPPRNVTPVGLSLYAAPVGMVAVAVLDVPDVAALAEWDAATTAQALALMEAVLTEQLASHRGYLVRRDKATGAMVAAFAFPLDAVRWALTCRELLSSVVEWPPALLAHEACREGLLTHHHQLPPSTHAGSRKGGASGGAAGPMGLRNGSGSGPLPSPCIGRGPTRPSMELSHALTASCDNTPVWTAALTGGPAAAVISHGTGPDGFDESRADTGLSAMGSSQPSYKAVVAANSSVDMEATPPAHQASVAGSRCGAPASTVNAAAAAPQPVGSGAVRSGGAARPCIHSHTWASKLQLPPAAAPQPHSASEGGVLQTATSADAGLPPKTAPAPVARPRTFGNLGSKVSALSARWRATAGGYLEGLVAAGRSGAYSVTVGRLGARRGHDLEPGRASGAAAYFQAQSTPAASAAGAVSSPAAPGAPAVGSCAASPRNGGTDCGPSSGCTSPKPAEVKSGLDWARSAEMEMETEDGGDMFSTHLGSMDGLGPFTHPPNPSASGAFGGMVGHSGATSGAEADRQDAVTLRGPRIRVGIDCGSVEWSISSSQRCLAYSGTPVTRAEKLAAAAAGGQVLATFPVMRELHRMQASLVVPEEPAEAMATEHDSGADFRKAISFRGPAVVGSLMPQASGRAGMGGSRHRRHGAFACRFTLDWEEALREHDLLVVQQALPLQAAHSGTLWNSPRGSRISPFASPWNWSVASRRKSKRGAGAAGAGAGGGAAASVTVADRRRSQDSRCSIDVHYPSSGLGPACPSPFGLTHQGAAAPSLQPPSPSTPAGAGPCQPYAQSNPLQGGQGAGASWCQTPTPTRASLEGGGWGSGGRLYGSAGPSGQGLGLAATAARYAYQQQQQPAAATSAAGAACSASAPSNVLQQQQQQQQQPAPAMVSKRTSPREAPSAPPSRASTSLHSARPAAPQPNPQAPSAPPGAAAAATSRWAPANPTPYGSIPSLQAAATAPLPVLSATAPAVAASPPDAQSFLYSRPSPGGASESLSLSLRHNLRKMSTNICSGSSAIGAGRSGEFALAGPLPQTLSVPAPAASAVQLAGAPPGADHFQSGLPLTAGFNGVLETGFASGVVGALTPALPPGAGAPPAPDAARAWMHGSSNRSARSSGPPSFAPGRLTAWSLHGSSGATAGASGGGGAAGSGGAAAGSGGDSSTSGTLRQALRQHRSSRRQQLRNNLSYKRQQLSHVFLTQVSGVLSEEGEETAEADQRRFAGHTPGTAGQEASEPCPGEERAATPPVDTCFGSPTFASQAGGGYRCQPPMEERASAERRSGGMGIGAGRREAPGAPWHQAYRGVALGMSSPPNPVAASVGAAPSDSHHQPTPADGAWPSTITAAAKRGYGSSTGSAGAATGAALAPTEPPEPRNTLTSPPRAGPHGAHGALPTGPSPLAARADAVVLLQLPHAALWASALTEETAEGLGEGDEDAAALLDAASPNNTVDTKEGLAWEGKGVHVGSSTHSHQGCCTDPVAEALARLDAGASAFGGTFEVGGHEPAADFARTSKGASAATASSGGFCAGRAAAPAPQAAWQPESSPFVRAGRLASAALAMSAAAGAAAGVRGGNGLGGTTSGWMATHRGGMACASPLSFGAAVGSPSLFAGAADGSLEMSGELDDSRTTVQPPAGWRPGIHPPPTGIAPPHPRFSASSDGYAHGYGASGVSGQWDGGYTEPPATVSGYVVSRANGGVGVGGSVNTADGGVRVCGMPSAADLPQRQSSSTGTVSAGRLQNAYPILDDPEVWRDESYGIAPAGAVAAAAIGPCGGARGRRV